MYRQPRRKPDNRRNFLPATTTATLPEALEKWASTNRPVFDWYASRLKGTKPDVRYVSFDDLDRVAAANDLDVFDLFAMVKEAVGDLGTMRLHLGYHEGNHAFHIQVRPSGH
jgi:hypothetical protein